MQQDAGLEEKGPGLEDLGNGLVVSCFGQDLSQFGDERVEALWLELKIQLMMSLIC